ncbi:ankyrin repeat and SOCS box protein 16 [Carlito syrichta]|uniref:Ankyrin repeat and SOCS box protein 16 n=1 Tax=Carlito syrichta TaxID=1868482 RepID=A0A3Q0DX50_CARSF|nr:ankyrin repeat and SOCS box protein 16 [Carlito syrichta]
MPARDAPSREVEADQQRGSQGFWVLTPKTKQTAPLTIAVAWGYTDCAHHLVQQGAELDARVGGRAALHGACAQAQPDCARLLLTFGAKANVLSDEGVAPLHLCTMPESLHPDGRGASVLPTADTRRDLKAGGGKEGMLKLCANFPRALEVLLNAYPCVPSCDTWVNVVLPEQWQEHEAFYNSALSMVNQPRCLQHLARLAVWTCLGSRCRQAAPWLPLPPLLRGYLLLRVEGRIQ